VAQVRVSVHRKWYPAPPPPPPKLISPDVKCLLLFTGAVFLPLRGFPPLQSFLWLRQKGDRFTSEVAGLPLLLKEPLVSLVSLPLPLTLPIRSPFYNGRLFVWDCAGDPRGFSFLLRRVLPSPPPPLAYTLSFFHDNDADNYGKKTHVGVGQEFRLTRCPSGSHPLFFSYGG